MIPPLLALPVRPNPGQAPCLKDWLECVTDKAAARGRGPIPREISDGAMAKPVLADSVIEAALQERCGTLSGFEKLAEGLDSQAYGFCHGNRDYVARINRSSRGFWKDAFVSHRFASPMLPIPEIVGITQLDDGHFICISRRAPGVRVHDLASVEFGQVMASVREVMAAIATSDLAGTTGFGRFDANGTGPHGTWQGFLASVADPQQFDWKQTSGVDMAVVSGAIRLVMTLVECCPERRCLVHGDFGSYNVMTDRRRITAVIDWDRALFGDPLDEIANLLFWREECLEQLTLALSAAADDEAAAKERLLCYQLRIGLQEIYESAIGETPVELAWLTARCKSLIDAGAAMTPEAAFSARSAKGDRDRRV
jgi:hygromycin-B 4-O-kinase